MGNDVSSMHINHLPPELLAQIFKLSLPGIQQRHNSKPTIVITSVCRHWREIALDYPALWTTIVLDRSSTALPELYLSRSSNCDLDFKIQSSHSLRHSWLARLMSTITPRLRSLSVEHDSPYFWPYLSSPAPHLELFKITSTPPVEAKPLFGGCTPQLRRLYLVTKYPFWPQELLRNLTHLHLSSLRASLRVSYSDFLSMIELNPNLEELVIKSAGLLIGLRTYRNVPMVKLRRFGMHKCRGHLIEFLLSCLAFPPSVAIVLSCPWDGVFWIKTLTKFIPNGFMDQFTFTKACLFTMPHTPNHYRVTLANRNAVFVFQIIGDPLLNIIGDLMAFPSLSLVEELYLSFNHDPMLNFNAIQAWLSALPNLTTLSMSIGAESLQAFQNDNHPPIEFTSIIIHNDKVRSPRLNAITIHVPPSAIPTSSPRWWTNFSGILSEREKRGHPTSRITVVHKRPTSNTLQTSIPISTTVMEICRPSPIPMDLPDICGEEVTPGKNWSNCWAWAII